jgi:hypothetical protein
VALHSHFPHLDVVVASMTSNRFDRASHLVKVTVDVGDLNDEQISEALDSLAETHCDPERRVVGWCKAQVSVDGQKVTRTYVSHPTKLLTENFMKVYSRLKRDVPFCPLTNWREKRRHEETERMKETRSELTRARHDYEKRRRDLDVLVKRDRLRQQIESEKNAAEEARIEAEHAMTTFQRFTRWCGWRKPFTF